MKTHCFVLTVLFVLFSTFVGTAVAQDTEAKPQPKAEVKAEPAASPAAVKPVEASKPGTKAPTPAPAAVRVGPVQATVISTKGSAEYRDGVGKPWKKVTVGAKLAGNSEISTGLAGEVVLRLDTNAEITIRRLTQVRIARLEKTDRANITKLDVKYGRLKANVKKGTLANDFKVKTARFSLSVTGTDISSIGFYRGFGGHVQMGSHGSIVMNGQMGPMPLGAGQSSDDKGTPPIGNTQKDQRTNMNMMGWTKWEQKAAFFSNSPMSPWEKLRPDNPGMLPGQKKPFMPQPMTPTPTLVLKKTLSPIDNHRDNGGNGDDRPPIIDF